MCMCACVCEALDAPSPRLCVCSHGQQGVNPLLSLLLHSGSLGGIIVLHLSLPGFILIGSTPDLPEKKKKKNLSESATYPVLLENLIFREQSRSDTETLTDVTPRGASHQGATNLLQNLLLLL